MNHNEHNSYGFNMPEKKPHPIAEEVSKKIKDASKGRHARLEYSSAKRFFKRSVASKNDTVSKSKSPSATNSKSPSTTNELIPLSEVHSTPLKDAGTGTIDAVTPDMEKRKVRIIAITAAVLLALVIAAVVLFFSGAFTSKGIDASAVNESQSSVLELSFGNADASAEQGYTRVSSESSAVFTADDTLSASNLSLTKKIKIENTSKQEANSEALGDKGKEQGTYAYELYVRYTNPSFSYSEGNHSAADCVQVTVNGSPLSVFSDEYVAEVREYENRSLANNGENNTVASDYEIEANKINAEASFEDALNSNSVLYQGILAPEETNEIEITFTLNQAVQSQFQSASEFPAFDIVLVGTQQKPVVAQFSGKTDEGQNVQGADIVFDEADIADLRKTDSKTGNNESVEENFEVNVRSEQELLAALEKPNHTIVIPEGCAIEVNQDLVILHDVAIKGEGTLVFNRLSGSSDVSTLLNSTSSVFDAGQESINQDTRFASFLLADTNQGKPTLCITGGTFIHVNPAEYREPNNNESATYTFLPSGYTVEQQSQDSFRVCALAG